MIFVFGGAYNGKGEYVKNKLGVEKITPYNAPYEELKKARAVRDFHLYARDKLANGLDVLEETERLIGDNPDVIIISDEVGCGVVPVGSFERGYREAVGRVHCYLAEKAERVIRIVCGIENVIK